MASWNDQNRHHAGPALKSGWYVRPPGALNGMTMTALRAYYMPLDIERAVSIDRIGTYCSAGGGSGKLFRFLIHQDVDGTPGPIILDAGTTSANSTGDREITVSKALPLSRVWLCIVSDGTPSVQAYTAHGGVGHTALTNITNTAYTCYQADQADLTAVASPTVSPGVGTAPIVAVRLV